MEFSFLISENCAKVKSYVAKVWREIDEVKGLQSTIDEWLSECEKLLVDYGENLTLMFDRLRYTRLCRFLTISCKDLTSFLIHITSQAE
jgi:regulator of sigma D